MDRDEFMELVYETFTDEPDNVLANGIIEAADAYVEHEKAQLSKEGATSDLISRRAALDEVEKNACNTQRIMDAVNNLPSAQPERAEGEWIVHLYKVGVSRYECDACHARCDIIYPYCPYCGEKKEGERDATN